MKRLLSILALITVLAGGASADWYPRSDNYTTTGWFVGDGLYLSGDGIIEGNLIVGGTPMWHVQTITTPAAAASGEVLNETAGAITTVGTNIDADNMNGTIDAARCLILTPGAPMTGDALLTGTNVNDEDITETINWEENATATTTAQAFKSLTWANFTTDTDTSVTIDYSDKLGLDAIPSDADAVMFTFLGGVMETTLPTVTIGATVAECSVDLYSALTGADVKIYVYEAV
ncbi:MAG: hypothetical protein QM433_02050 [Euryarchaeota archaeon]|nr:hypothetical protein [Euryarchaeota archaeon]